MNSTNADYMVIGAGTAGSVVAGRLSENGKYSVCVLEAGPKDNNPFFHIPAGVLRTLRNPALNWMYKGVGSPGLNGRVINHARGKALGKGNSRGSRQKNDTRTFVYNW